MIGILPHSLRAELRRNTGQRQVTKLKDYLDIRDFIDDNSIMLENEKCMMQLYKEAGEDLRCASETVRKNLRVIREYSSSDLFGWVEAGLSWNHVEKANSLRPDSPASLLDQAVELGNGEGKPMTVDEMIDFELSDKPERKNTFHVNKYVGLMLGKFTKLFKWSDEKAHMFEARLRDLISEFESDKAHEAFHKEGE